jgi:ABC-2 type transport system permease protein
MTLRRGETLLLTLIIPIVLLVFFSRTSVLAAPPGGRIAYLAPGMWALAIMSTSLVALSIATGFERTYGVLRRLHVTPLGRARLIGAKVVAVLVTEIIQIAVLSGVALALGWRPHGGPSAVGSILGAVLLGTLGCAGLGLLLAGSLRAEVNLAATNGLYLVLLLGSGIVVPLTSLPASVRSAAAWLPTGALADSLHRVLGSGHLPSGGDWISLVVWAVLAPGLAARSFRFD